MREEELRRLASAWAAEDPDPATRLEVTTLLQRDDVEGLRERFGSRLEFGTAGIRGILGAGPNRMNRMVVMRTTAGLAAYLKAKVPDAARRGVVVGYDARHLSLQASQDVASILAGHGIPALVFPDFAPTPLTAFAVRHLGAAAGVMITASHNPPEYNGYKVYWSNGAQIVPPHDRGISEAIDRVGPLASIPRMEEKDARAKGLWRDIDGETTRAYLESVARQSVTSDGKDLVEIVYTPLHGVGGALALRALREHGFTKLHVVQEQFDPDPDFPTVRFPNPEEAGAMDLAIALAQRTGASLVLANDPDADRLAVAVPDPRGGYRLLSGNEIGLLFTEYLLANDPREGERLVLSTIVSTPGARAIAEHHGARYDEVLTGFKWIANRAMEIEAETGARFVLGFEEALGYSIGTTCRDKDGIGAAVIFAELAAHAAARGRTILDELESIWRTHGLYLSRQHSVTLQGEEGKARIDAIMEGLRKDSPLAIDGKRVVLGRDYREGVERDARTGEVRELSLPSSNVLSFFLEDGTRIIARPSGTEPKIKYYVDVRVDVAPDVSIAEAEAAGRRTLESRLGAFLDHVRSI
ncbi:MAG: phospho-sugar mutase [Pseudomonadota bacterium]